MITYRVGIVLYSILIVTSIIGSSVSVPFGGLNISLFKCLFPVLFAIIILKSRKNLISNQVLFTICFLLFWFLYAMVSLAWIVNIQLWVVYTTYIIIFVWSVFLALIALKTNDDIYRIVKVYIKMWQFCTIVGLWEICTGIYLFIGDYSSIQMTMQNPLCFTKNVNDFSTFLTVGSILSMVVDYKKSLYINGNIFFIILTFFEVYYGESRANMLGLILAVFVFCLFKFGKKNIRYFLKFLYFIGVASILVFLYQTFALDYLVNYFEFGSSNYIRINLINNGIKMLNESCMIGVGAGNSNVIEYMVFDTCGIVNLHNFWLQIFVEYGVLIGIAFFINYGIMMIQMMSIFRLSTNFLPMRMAAVFLCVQIILLISLVSTSNAFQFEWLFLLWGVMNAFISINYRLCCITK